MRQQSRAADRSAPVLLSGTLDELLLVALGVSAGLLTTAAGVLVFGQPGMMTPLMATSVAPNGRLTFAADTPPHVFLNQRVFPVALVDELLERLPCCLVTGLQGYLKTNQDYLSFLRGAQEEE
jgi:hypothetical protein